jgi:hypothetical protein
MFRSLNSGFRLSETTDSKRSSPIKINVSLLRSTNQPLTQSTELAHPPDFKPECASLLDPIGEDERFECSHEFQNEKSCQICKGAGFVKGSHNLIKFFEYLIAFKMGLNPSYRDKKLANHRKSEVNSFCNDFYSKNEAKRSTVRSTASNFTYRINTRAS